MSVLGERKVMKKRKKTSRKRRGKIVRDRGGQSKRQGRGKGGGEEMGREERSEERKPGEFIEKYYQRIS